MALTERAHAFTVSDVLAAAAREHPERDFLRFDDEVLTYRTTDEQARAMAAALAHLGVEPGDRVALVLPSWPEFAVSLFAAAYLGAAVVPLDPRLSPGELRYMLRHSEAVVAISAETFHGVDFLEVFEDLVPHLPELQYLVTVGEEDLWYDDRIFQFEDVVSMGRQKELPGTQVDPGTDLFSIVYTAGTTGKPKGVELTHRNLVYVAAATADCLGLEPDDRVFGVSALFHVFGMGTAVLGSALSGSSLILQEEFQGPEALDLVERHGATVHYGVPSVFVTELHEQRRNPRDLSSLRTGLVAGAPVGKDVITEVEENLCPDLRVAYSVTEASSTVCVTRTDDPEEKRHHTVGRPIPGTRVRILGEDGKELPEESLGEVAVQGPGVMRGYYRQPMETARVFDEDGYLRTGDLGILDEDGYIHLVGRSREVIIRGGFNIYPREVEDRLHQHPAVRDAVVVGVPDDVLGEATCASIIPVEGAIVDSEEIQEWCRETLAEFKIPDVVRFLDAFPLTATGKVRRAELARMMAAEVTGRRT